MNKCHFCENLFKTSTSLKNHVTKIHVDKGDKMKKSHKCEACSKSFTKAHYLKTHIHTVHEGHKDYKCESCGKSISKVGDLNLTQVQCA